MNMLNSMSAAVRNFYANYAQFQGRSSVAQYWWVVLFLFIISIIFSCFIFCCNEGSFFFWVWQVAAYIWSLFNLIPSIALSIRRLHDTGRGGGWIFINFLPLIGSIWFIILMLLPSDPQENRFGYPQNQSY